MSVPVPPCLIKNPDGTLKAYINRDPKQVDPTKCVHFPEPGEPSYCYCTHDASITSAVGERNVVTGASDANWGPLPRKNVPQRYLPR